MNLEDAQVTENNLCSITVHIELYLDRLKKKAAIFYRSLSEKESKSKVQSILVLLFRKKEENPESKKKKNSEKNGASTYQCTAGI